MKCIIEGCEGEAGFRGLCDKCRASAQYQIEAGWTWSELEQLGLALSGGVWFEEPEDTLFDKALSRTRGSDGVWTTRKEAIILAIIEQAGATGVTFSQLQRVVGFAKGHELTGILKRLRKSEDIADLYNDRRQRVYMSKRWADRLRRQRAEVLAKCKAEVKASGAEAMRKDAAEKLKASPFDPEPCGLAYWIYCGWPALKINPAERGSRPAAIRRAILSAMWNTSASSSLSLSDIKDRVGSVTWIELLSAMAGLMRRTMILRRSVDGREEFYLTEPLAQSETA